MAVINAMNEQQEMEQMLRAEAEPQASNSKDRVVRVLQCSACPQ